MSITIAIIILTVLVSLPAFQNEKLMSDLIFYPTAVTYRKQWYRFITCGFIHADLPHLIFNMYALYMFGEVIENFFGQIFGVTGKLIYILLYLTSLVACLLPSYAKHKEDYSYASLGASGAISAVSFCYMILAPTAHIGLIFIPGKGIPAWLFAPLYLIVTSYLAKQPGSRINHSAHLWGAIYGIAFIIVTGHFLADFGVITNFINQVSASFR